MSRRYDFGSDKEAHVRRSARSFGNDRSLFFYMEPWTLPIRNQEGRHEFYDPKRIEAMRKRLKGVDKKRYLRDIVDRVLAGAADDRDRVNRLCGFVNDALYYNPIEQPQENGTGDLLSDPVELLELHDGRCGQGVMATLALMEAAGIEARCRNVFHHVTCEAKYGGRWHLADALMFGDRQPERDGAVVSVAQLQRDPYYADAFPLRNFVYTPEELLSRDGYQLLGYCFGQWGTLAYYSWYMGGDEEYPPTLPVVLPPRRIDDESVELQWAPSAKRNGGAIRYRVAVYEDRERTRPLLSRTVSGTRLKWRVPEQNRMYFIGVAATDDHVQKNPDTWYPEAVGNFVLVPKDRYGWYGVM